MAGTRCEVSVVIPAYNEAERIERTLEVTSAELTGAGLSFELIVVDDGSPDNTAEVVEKYCRKKGKGRVRLVSYHPNQGKGFALKRGVFEAKGRYIAFFDADLDISPDHIHKYLDILKKRKVDGVVGSKRHPDSELEYSKIRILISNIYYLFNRFFFRLKVKDTQSGMKIFRRDILVRTVPRLLVKRFAFDLEMLVVMIREKARILEAPLAITGHQEYGRIGIMSLWHSFVDTIAVFYRLFFLRYYNWSTIPSIGERRRALTILIDSPGYSNRLADLVEYLQSGILGDLRCVVLADKGNFDFPGVQVLETGHVSPWDKIRFALKKVKGQSFGFVSDRVIPSPGWLLSASCYLKNRDVVAVTGPVQRHAARGAVGRIIGKARLHPLVRGRYRLFAQLKRQRKTTLLPPENLFFNKSGMLSLLKSDPMEQYDDEGTPYLETDKRALYSSDLGISALPLFTGFSDYFRHLHAVSEFRGRYHERGVFIIPFMAVFLITATVFALFSGVFRSFFFPFAGVVFGLLYLIGNPFPSPFRSLFSLFANVVSGVVKFSGIMRGLLITRKSRDRN